MKLKHPDSKLTVDTDSPGIYQSQGWAEVEKPKSDK